MINKNKIFGMRLIDPQLFQLDFYGVKKYEGINEEDSIFSLYYRHRAH